MSKAARQRAARTEREQRAQAQAQAKREALVEAGYPIEALQEAMVEQHEVSLRRSAAHWRESVGGRIVKLSVGAGETPRLFALLELKPEPPKKRR